MCKVSEETILKANERMRKYKIGQNNKNVSPMGFTLETQVQGKTYSQTFTENSINAIFERVLSNRQHGKALYIYEELVRYEGDLVGRVAYSLYKREKIAFIEQ